MVGTNKIMKEMRNIRRSLKGHVADRSAAPRRARAEVVEARNRVAAIAGQQLPVRSVDGEAAGVAESLVEAELGAEVAALIQPLKYVE